MKTIGKRLEEDRAARGIVAAKQAELIGLSAGHLSRLCNGKVSMGSKVATKIASHLGVAEEEIWSLSQEVRVKSQVLITSNEFVFLSKAAEAMNMPLSIALAVSMVIARRESGKTE